MKVKEFNKECLVMDYSLTRAGGKVNLKWNYKQGKYFLVFLYDARNMLHLEHIIRELEEKELDDRLLMERNAVPFYTTGSEVEKIFLCRETEYIQNNQTYSIAAKELKSGVPYAVSVFIADYDKTSGEIGIYPVKAFEMNTQFIPVKINPMISYKNKFLSADRICVLKLSPMQDYQDGALEYYVTGVGGKAEYPIPASCLGKELLIQIPKDSEVVVRASDKYKNYYRV